MEKTFIDLIQQERERVKDFQGLDSTTVFNLMQQVREATKMECRNIASEFSLADTLRHIDNLPTDRIKVEPE